jgi:predicted esterase
MKTLLLGLGLLYLHVTAFSQQIPRSLTAANGTFIGFYEYKPVDYSANPGKKYPLIIFLHGIGERGNGTTDLPKVMANGIPYLINGGNPMTFTYNGQTETFLVLCPQLSTSYGDWQNFYTDEMLKYARQNLQVDTNRIYLTGLSLGGGGVWLYSEASLANAKQFAAIAPMCGSTFNAQGACNISQAHLPVWAFHCMDDGTVNVNVTVQSIASINLCNPLPNPAPIATYYPTGGHWGAWVYGSDPTHTYQSPLNLYEWFLSKTRASGGGGTVTNQSPVANAGSAAAITLPANAVTLSGSGSYDPDGSIAGYSWSYVSGPSQYTIGSPNAASTAVSNLIAGNYTFKLTVTDNLGASSSAPVAVTVKNAVVAGSVIAVAGPSQSITTASTILNAWGTTSSNGPITNYNWQQQNGPNTAIMDYGNSATPTIRNLITGIYKFKLTVTDNTGATASDTTSVTVNGGGAPGGTLSPVAIAGPTQNITSTTAILNSWGSYSPNGAITSYKWTQESGPNTATMDNSIYATATISNLVSGTYKFKLVITDNAGATAIDYTYVIVSGPSTSPSLPVAVAGPPQTVSGTTAILNAWGTYSPNGSITSYNWAQVSGPNTAKMDYNIYTTVSLTSLIPGTYTFKLTVNDVTGATAFATTTVTVTGSGTSLPVAIAGLPQTITGTSAILNAWGTYSPNGNIVSYNWAQVSGPNVASMDYNFYTTATLANLTVGTYTFKLTVKDVTGATASATTTVTVTSTVPGASVASAGLQTDNGAINSSTVTKVFPNPVTDQLNIYVTTPAKGNGNITVYDLTGRAMQQKSFVKTQDNLNAFVNMKSLVPGLYLVEIKMENGYRITERIIKQ